MVYQKAPVDPSTARCVQGHFGTNHPEFVQLLKIREQLLEASELGVAHIWNAIPINQ
jgi:hypothetical protein